MNDVVRRCILLAYCNDNAVDKVTMFQADIQKLVATSQRSDSYQTTENSTCLPSGVYFQLTTKPKHQQQGREI